MQRVWAAIGAGGAISVAALLVASSFVADVFDHQEALGAPLLSFAGQSLYPPWRVLEWSALWGRLYPAPFAVAHFILLAGLGAAGAITTLIVGPKSRMAPFAKGAWGDFAQAHECGLFAQSGAVLGKLDGEILCFDGAGHQLLVGASRSGKGRGHVVPTLLAWPESALVLDTKGELADGDERHQFAGTAGFRETLGPVLRFAPTRLDCSAFNPLFEVRRGANEVRDVQNIVEVLVDPGGESRYADFWDRSAKSILVGVILHVLYTETPQRKTLAVVRERLRDLDATAHAMRSTLHRLSPETNRPEVHPEVLHAAESFLAGEERLQAGVKATAESFFGLFADEIVARNTARSDFRIGDLMCWERPVTLYLQPPPSDALRLMPLLRLLINQFARALMEHQTRDAEGRAKRRRLLLLLDEFPLLGRMPFFETMMGAMAGYGLKALLVCQSLNHLTKAYGRDNVILDNCHIVAAFAAADTDTAKRIADMAGEAWELRDSETRTRPQPLLGWRKGATTTREERRPLITPAQVRALASDEQLIFVAGAKPIRAKKLGFDTEPVFASRIQPSANHAVTLSSEHDWTHVGPLGFIAQTGRRQTAKLAMSTPLAEQGDLFAEAALRRDKISDRAMAGFRNQAGDPLAHPATQDAAKASASDSSRPSRAKGI